MNVLSMIKLRLALLVAIMMAGILFFSSCNNDDDTYLPPNKEIVNALNRLYPGAWDVEWSQKGVYFVADCKFDGNELDVWFDANANWLMTEVDIPYEQLPASVNTAFQNSTYAGWVIDDLTLLSYPSQASQYVFEVQQRGREMAVYFSEFGDVLRENDITNADDTIWPNVTPPQN